MGVLKNLFAKDLQLEKGLLVRQSLRTAPLFVFDAPVSSSGKTLLADVVGIIATGRTLPAKTYSGDETDERRERIRRRGTEEVQAVDL